MDFFGLNLYALHGSLGSVCLGLLPNLESFQSLFLPAPSVPSSFNSGPVTTQMLDLLLFSHRSQRHRSLLFSVDFPLSPRLREFCCSVLKLTDSLLCYLCCTAELTQQELVFSFAFSFYNFPLVLSLFFSFYFVAEISHSFVCFKSIFNWLLKHFFFIMAALKFSSENPNFRFILVSVTVYWVFSFKLWFPGSWCDRTFSLGCQETLGPL